MPRDYVTDPETIEADEYDALLISEWLSYRQFDPLLPASADWGAYKWAHENKAAWAMVELPDGLSVNEALTIMVTRAMFESRSRSMEWLRAKRFNPYHDNKGRFASKGAGGGNSAVQARLPGDVLSQDEVHDLYEDVKNKGGFTYNVNTAHYQETGYAVSPYPMESREIALYDFSPEDIHQYALEKQAFLHSADHYLGAWHDKGPDTVWLDVVVVKKDKAQAVALAKQHNQKAIFDLETFEEIDTGGTGRSQRALEASGLERSVSKKSSACEACRTNDDPWNVPVHPGCNCDINTESVEMGVDADEMRALLDRHGESAIEAIGLDDVPEALDLMPGSASVFGLDDFRFGDWFTWTRSHGATDAGTALLNVLIQDGKHVVAARALRLMGEAAGLAYVIAKSTSERANSPTPRVVIVRADATPEELAAAYRIILEGQQ